MNRKDPRARLLDGAIEYVARHGLADMSLRTLAKSLTVLKPGGIAIGIAGPPDPDFARQQGLRLPLRLAMALLSFRTRRAARRQEVRYSFLFMRASGAQLDEVAKLIDADVLRPIVDRTYPFDEAPQALAHVEGGRTKGKVVITIASPAAPEPGKLGFFGIGEGGPKDASERIDKHVGNAIRRKRVPRG